MVRSTCFVILMNQNESMAVSKNGDGARLVWNSTMFSKVVNWLPIKWRLRIDAHTLDAYAVVFQTAQGQLVLQHLLDTIYCQIYEGNDPLVLAFHNGQRTVVHNILENIDRATQPAKYIFVSEVEASNGVLR